jgi:hypothetical protein
MEELLLALLYGIAETLLECLGELALGAIADLFVRSIRNLVAESKAINPSLAALGYFLLGAGSGALSVLILPHPLLHPSPVHGVSLVVSPLLTGLAMSQVGLALRRRGKQAIRIESFGYGFTFALGMAIVRFIFVK